MNGSPYRLFTDDQIGLLQTSVIDLLETQGVKLDDHPEMPTLLKDAGAIIDPASRIVRFPRGMVERLLKEAPRTFVLGARDAGHRLELPRAGGGFYGRSGTGAHGWIDPESGAYRKITKTDLTAWARLINHLDEIHFLPFLYMDDVPVQTADIHGLHTLLVNSPKHAWVQPYSTGSIPYLLQMAEAAAGGSDPLRANPVISMIACSLTPRTFKYMDIEIILQAARAGIPIHACSLPGAGGTSPATMPGTILLATAEILAMTVMAQAVSPGAPVVACPIIFATDMRTGRSLQSSTEAMRGAAGAVQFIKAAFGLPTHNYGSGADAVQPGEQSQTQRTLLSTLMRLSGSDILGGAGQLEVATAVSPLQLIIDNEIFSMLRHIDAPFVLDEEQLAMDLLADTPPGQHFLTSTHTLRHCRDGYISPLFTSPAREPWEADGKKGLMDLAMAQFQELTGRAPVAGPDQPVADALQAILSNADATLIG